MLKNRINQKLKLIASLYQELSYCRACFVLRFFFTNTIFLILAKLCNKEKFILSMVLSKRLANAMSDFDTNN